MSGYVILGATGSIGSALARRLVQAGHAVLLMGRNPEKLAVLADELGQPCVVNHVASAKPLEQAIRAATTSFPQLDGIVNCIGSVLLKPAHATSDAEFREVIETNLFTAFATVAAGANLLKEHGGAIVLFASAAAEIGMMNHEAIAAAKAGVIGLARSAAATYAPRNIRVNAVSPGLVKSEMTRRLWESPAAEALSRELHPLHRLGEPEHVAGLVMWLLSAENSWMTGQAIGFDGGLSSVLPRRKASS